MLRCNNFAQLWTIFAICFNVFALPLHPENTKGVDLRRFTFGPGLRQPKNRWNVSPHHFSSTTAVGASLPTRHLKRWVCTCSLLILYWPRSQFGPKRVSSAVFLFFPQCLQGICQWQLQVLSTCNNTFAVAKLTNKIEKQACFSQKISSFFRLNEIPRCR